MSFVFRKMEGQAAESSQFGDDELGVIKEASGSE